MRDRGRERVILPAHAGRIRNSPCRQTRELRSLVVAAFAVCIQSGACPLGLSHTVFLLGQAEQFVSSCGATRLDALAPTLSYVRMPLSCLIIFSVHYIMHEVRCIPTYAELCLRRFKAPSPILCGALREDSARAAFQVALGSPFGKTLHTAISAPAVLCREGMSLLTHSSSTV